MEVFWVDFHEPPIGLGLGLGVTAFDKEDALRIVEDNFGQLSAERITIVESIDQLEANHVRRNMGNFLKRGIWFPNNSDWSS
jgi:hypothetical protein